MLAGGAPGSLAVSSGRNVHSFRAGGSGLLGLLVHGVTSNELVSHRIEE